MDEGRRIKDIRNSESFGAAWALCALAREDHGFQAAALECPFTTLDEYWYAHRVPFMMLKVINTLFPKLMLDLRPIAQIERVRDLRGLLLIYGKRDQVTPREMGERFLRRCALPAERVALWSVPEAEHTKALAAAPEAYRDRLLRFFDGAFAA